MSLKNENLYSGLLLRRLNVVNDYIPGAEVESKISEIVNILSTLDQSSTEYQLISSVYDMLQNIANLLQTRRLKRSSTGEI